MNKSNFVIERIKSIGFAFRGLFLLIRSEPSFQIQCVIGILITLTGFYFQISMLEWLIQLICIAMVMGMEALNTAIEKLADYIQPKFDKQIGVTKDISASAVMIVSIISVIVGCIIYIPKVAS